MCRLRTIAWLCFVHRWDKFGPDLSRPSSPSCRLWHSIRHAFHEYMNNYLPAHLSLNIHEDGTCAALMPRITSRIVTSGIVSCFTVSKLTLIVLPKMDEPNNFITSAAIICDECYVSVGMCLSSSGDLFGPMGRASKFKLPSQLTKSFQSFNTRMIEMAPDCVILYAATRFCSGEPFRPECVTHFAPVFFIESACMKVS